MELYHLRHAQRIGKNPHISKEGLLFAQEIGRSLPSFDVVLSSKSLRAIETAIAMCYPITDTINFDETTPAVKSPDSNHDFKRFNDYFYSIQENPYYKDFTVNLVQLLTTKLSEYMNVEKILIISHGGVIECSTIGFLPDTDYSDWGSCVTHCKGVKLVFRDNKCISGEKIN